MSTKASAEEISLRIFGINDKLEKLKFAKKILAEQNYLLPAQDVAVTKVILAMDVELGKLHQLLKERNRGAT